MATIVDPIEPRLDAVQCISPQGLHRMAYWEWGDPANDKVVICVHGLSRQGRDFDVLAQALMNDFRVVCPDVVGRGQSGWLADASGYQNFQYAADMVTLIARIDAKQLYWVGTSMGGLIGLGLAPLAGSPIEKLVLNDVGPNLNADALARIGTYLGKAPPFKSADDAADYLQSVSKGFGPHTREQWLALSRPMLKPNPNLEEGGVVLHYDPKIALPFASFSAEALAAGQQMLWRAFDNVKCPTLLLRGGDSDLLTAETAAEMTTRGPKPKMVEFAGVGHAPTLVAPDQVAAVREFLLGP
jgi:pimeloyl-ACP methyl ester carboxylesterase